MFDVSSNSTVEEMSKNEIRVPWGVGIVGYVAKTGESCNVNDCYQDSRWAYGTAGTRHTVSLFRFNQDIDELTGYRTRTMMCSAIKVMLMVELMMTVII